MLFEGTSARKHEIDNEFAIFGDDQSFETPKILPVKFYHGFVSANGVYYWLSTSHIRYFTSFFFTFQP